jgi:hypothetical protein
MFFGIGLRLSPPSLSSPSLNFLVLADTPEVASLNELQMARTHGVAVEAEEAAVASARRYAPSISTCLASCRQKMAIWMSKAAMKAKRAHAEV